MPTSTRFVVSVHILTGLAVSDGKPMRSEDIANSANTSAVVIRGLLSRLGRAGLTKSQLGTGGGTVLAKPAADISLLNVYEAVEDTELFSIHRIPPCANCLVGGNILEAMQPILTRARAALEQELAKKTIADIGTEVARLGKFSLPLLWIIFLIFSLLIVSSSLTDFYFLTPLDRGARFGTAQSLRVQAVLSFTPNVRKGKQHDYWYHRLWCPRLQLRPYPR